MVVDRLVWFWLRRSFEDRNAPPWFHQRVQDHVMTSAPDNPIAVRHHAVLLLLPLVGILAERRLLHGVGSPVLTWILVAMFLCLVTPLLMAPHVRQGYRLLKDRKATYACAVETTRSGLTGHEYFEYEAYRQGLLVQGRCHGR